MCGGALGQGPGRACAAGCVAQAWPARVMPTHERRGTLPASEPLYQVRCSAPAVLVEASARPVMVSEGALGRSSRISRSCSLFAGFALSQIRSRNIAMAREIAAIWSRSAEQGPGGQSADHPSLRPVVRAGNIPAGEGCTPRRHWKADHHDRHVVDRHTRTPELASNIANDADQTDPRPRE